MHAVAYLSIAAFCVCSELAGDMRELRITSYFHMCLWGVELIIKGLIGRRLASTAPLRFIVQTQVEVDLTSSTPNIFLILWPPCVA